MTTAELIARAHAQAKAAPMYSYNPEILERLVTEGLFSLPLNEPIVRRGDQYLVYTGPTVDCYKVVDGSPTKTRSTPANDAALESLVIQHAVDASRTSTRMGAIA